METKNKGIPRRIERAYARAIAKLIQGLLPRAAGSPFLFAEKIRRLARSPTFLRRMDAIVRRMATAVMREGATSWRMAARAGSNGRMIHALIKREISSALVGTAYEEIISRNASYIRSLPDVLADKATKVASEGYAAGHRPTEVMKDILREVSHLSVSRARLIARTETSKASTALTEARCRSAGVGWYVWRTSEDIRVRDSHRKMHGVLCAWDDPPSPERLIGEKDAGNYHAGNIYNCRCYPEALIRLDQVSWPARVCYGGRIARMTMADFKELWR